MNGKTVCPHDRRRFLSQETALLLALLTNNKSLTVLACISALHYDRTYCKTEKHLDGLAI